MTVTKSKKVGQHEGPNKTSTSTDNMKPWPTINMIKLLESKLSEDTIRTKDFTIIIEGNIGTGKSTLLKYLKKIH